MAERFRQTRPGARNVDPIVKRTVEFAGATGRRPRVLVTGSGQNRKDRNTMAVVTRLAGKGFDVDISPTPRTPLILARMAVENDVHVICLTGLAHGGKTLPRLTDALLSENGRDILVAVEGENPAPGQDAALNDVAVLYNFNGADDAVGLMLDALERGEGRRAVNS